jgi:hypothetical protein
MRSKGRWDGKRRETGAKRVTGVTRVSFSHVSLVSQFLPVLRKLRLVIALLS